VIFVAAGVPTVTVDPSGQVIVAPPPAAGVT
jgi:hypothetical protein